MAIVEKVIADELVKLSNILKTQTDQEQGIKDWSNGLAKVIADAIKSADVTGVVTTVATTGTADAQTGVGTQNNLGKLL